MSDFAVKILNHEAVFGHMRKVKLKLKDRTKVNQRAALFIFRWIVKNFDAQGEYTTSGGWAPLAASTLLARKKGWGNYIKSSKPKILMNTGDLRNNWTLSWNSRKALVKSKMKYAIIHEKGNSSNRPPKRKILPTHKMIIKDLRKIYGHYIEESIKK